MISFGKLDSNPKSLEKLLSMLILGGRYKLLRDRFMYCLSELLSKCSDLNDYYLDKLNDFE